MNSMTAPRFQADLSEVRRLLHAWLERHCSSDEMEWLRAKQAEIQEGAPTWKFYTSFSAVPRYIRKIDLELTETDLEEADAARPGWSPRGWSLDEAGRALLVLSLPTDDPDSYVDTLDQVFSSADVRESVVLYQLLPVFPFPDRFRARAAEGLRTNMTSVFNAVAHRNPFPMEYLDEPAWNQMILKALFVGSSLNEIQGIDTRANAELARMIVDYAHERWAASRSVPPELWRPVGPFAGDDYIEDLAVAWTSRREIDREAAALALFDAGTPRALEFLDSDPELKRRVTSGELTWDTLSAKRDVVDA